MDDRDGSHDGRPNFGTSRRVLRYVTTAGKIAVAVGLLWWLIASGKLDLRSVISPTHRGAQVLGLGAIVVSMLLQYVRWWIILREIGVTTRLRDAIEISLIAQFLSAVLPGAAGSEIVRAVYVGRSDGGTMLSGAVSVVADRGIGLCTLLWVSVTGLIVLVASSTTDQESSTETLVGVVAAAFVGSLLVIGFLNRKARGVAVRLVPLRLRERVDNAAESLASDRRRFAAALALSLAATTCIMVSFVAAGWSVESGADFVTVSAVAPVVLVVSIVPISPGGLGVAEASAAYSFAHFGVPKGADMMAIYRLWYGVAALPGGLLYIVRRKRG